MIISFVSPLANDCIFLYTIYHIIARNLYNKYIIFNHQNVKRKEKAAGHLFGNVVSYENVLYKPIYIRSY